MPSASSHELKERVKQAVDIVDLVGGYMSLRRQGRNYVGLCPWHDDRRPSMQVNPERQTFKCWVCNIGGDVFSFIMQREGVTFPEALAMLAERAGISLEERRPSSSYRSGSHSGGPSTADWIPDDSDYIPDLDEEAAAIRAEANGDDGQYAPQQNRPAAIVLDKPTLFKAMAWAVSEFHHYLLTAEDAEPARCYLRERGINDDSIARFQLGYAPDRWDWMVDRVKHKPSAIAALEKIGVLGRSERGKTYDRFKGRVLFPVFNWQGRAIALGGRILPDLAKKTTNDRPPAKYINSPETPLFRKHREFYAGNLAREPISRMKRVFVMEGYTDVIVAHQFGFPNAVAVLGTALGASHVEQLGKLAYPHPVRVVLVLDGDDAGRRRAGEVLELFLASDVDLHVLTLPNDLDPCDFLTQRGSEAFASIMNKSVDAFQFGIDKETAGIDLSDTHQSNVALERILSTFAAIKSTAGETVLRMHQSLTRLERVFRVPIAEINGRLAALRRRTASRPRLDHDAPQRAAPAKIELWERALLELLLLEPEAVPQVAQTIPPARWPSPLARQIFAAACELSARGEHPDFDRLMLVLHDAPVQSLLVDLDEHATAQNISDVPVRIRQSLENFQYREDFRRTPTLRADAPSLPNDEQEDLRKLQDLLQRERARQGISGPTDG